MNMPGFTAESSLYKSQGSYLMEPTQTSTDQVSLLHPQQLVDIPFTSGLECPSTQVGVFHLPRGGTQVFCCSRICHLIGSARFFKLPCERGLSACPWPIG